MYMLDRSYGVLCSQPLRGRGAVLQDFMSEVSVLIGLERLARSRRCVRSRLKKEPHTFTTR